MMCVKYSIVFKKKKYVSNALKQLMHSWNVNETIKFF